MTIDERIIFFGQNVVVPPARLWFVRGDANYTVTPVSAHPLVNAAVAILAGSDPDVAFPAGYKVDAWKGVTTEGHPDEFATLIRSVAGGWHGDPIDAVIDERGRIIVTNGIHRTTAAFASHLSSIPTRILWRHPRWLAVKWALYELNGGCKLYQPVDHPDLAAWPAWRTDTPERARRIAAWLREHRPEAKTGLDYACNAGGILCALTRDGFSMTGYDLDLKAVQAASALRPMEPPVGVGDSWPWPDVHAILPPVLFYNYPGLRIYDFIICLSLFNHHATDGRTAEGLTLFKSMFDNAPVVFVDCPSPGEPVGGDTPLVEPENMLAWLATSGAPGHGEVIARRGEGGLQRAMMVWLREKA